MKDAIEGLTIGIFVGIGIIVIAWLSYDTYKRLTSKEIVSPVIHEKITMTAMSVPDDLTEVDTGMFVLSKDEMQKLAKSGQICKEFGHSWRMGRPGEGEGSEYGGFYADYHPGVSYRTCRICGKCESQTLEWKEY